MESCFVSGEQPELPFTAHPLSASGSFSERTLHLLSICLPVPVHLAEMQATSSDCRLGNRDHWSPLYWYGALLIRWQRCLAAGPTVEGQAGGLSRSFILPLFSPYERPKGTFPVESGVSVAPPHPNVGIHPGTCPHPYDMPFLVLIDPLHLPTPWQQGSYFSCLHNATLADHDN